MKTAMRMVASLILITVVLGVWGCTSAPSDSQNKAPANTSTAPPPAPVKVKTTATGKLTAAPNPIKVCDKSGTGITTISWTATGTTAIEVRVGRPDGDLFAKAVPDGSWKTGKWVGNGMVFYLQDVSGGKPLTAENTIATTVVNVTAAGCP
jgi:hypothetical protein